MRHDSRLQRRIYSVVFLMFVCGALARPGRADLWAISTHESDSRVIRFNHENGSELPNGVPSFSAGLFQPSGIAIRGEKVFVSSRGTGKIFFYDSVTGNPLTLPGGDLGVFANLGDDEDPAAPAQLRFGPDGNLYVSEFFGTKVRVYDPDMGGRQPDAAVGLASAGGLAFMPNGDLLVGDGFGSGGRIVRVEPGMPEVLNTFGMTGGGMLSSPTSLLFLSNGDLLAVDLLGNYIARFDENGVNFQPFATVPPPIPPMPWPPGANIPSNSPADIVFDPDGNLILAVLGFTGPPGEDSGALIRYDLNGNIIDPDNDMIEDEPIIDGLEQIGGLAWTAAPDTLLGNYDGMGGVDAADYAKWRSDFGKWVAPGNGADGNGDGVVDAADYIVWRKGTAAGSGASSPPPRGVPEPSAVVLVLGSAVAVATIRIRRSSLLSQRGQGG